MNILTSEIIQKAATTAGLTLDGSRIVANGVPTGLEVAARRGQVVYLRDGARKASSPPVFSNVVQVLRSLACGGGET